jgi:site-specific recombinase XerD
MTGLPQALESHEVERLLESCNRTSAAGRRNFAILLLLARLGLRAGDVVNLALEDVDWEAGEITVGGKSGRRDRLPLPRDVGQALADYLKRGRPQCPTRRVFVRAKAPYIGFVDSAAITTLVSRAVDRAGLHPPHKGAHLLRHTLATQMLRRGASLSEIGEILRHRNPDTTAIYAKVDLDRLRTLARRWPGGAV